MRGPRVAWGGGMFVARVTGYLGRVPRCPGMSDTGHAHL